MRSIVSINNEIRSEKETFHDTITFSNAKKSKNITLNGSDMLLLQILQSLENESDCVSVANTPPRMVMATTGAINTSSNESIVEKV